MKEKILKHILLALILQLQTDSDVWHGGRSVASASRYELVDSVFNIHKESFRQCFQKNVLHDGSIVLIFVLKNGTLQRVGIQESNLPISLKVCLIKVTWKMKFPYIKGTIQFKKPLHFDR